MLCLSRKRNEEIRIGDAVRVVVTEIRGDRGRLAIEAPNEIPVHRGEVWAAIQQERGPAAA